MSIDSQSVKSVAFINSDKGIDDNKFINGRKRHLIVDTLGLVWGVVAHAANIPDGQKAHLLVEHCLGYLERMQKSWWPPLRSMMPTKKDFYNWLNQPLSV